MVKKIGIVLLIITLIIVVNDLITYTPQIANKEGIADLKKVKLGDYYQHVLIRGKSSENPILLFLHGGPGYPQIAYARKYLELLEEDFLVVNWDQLGSGKSYNLKIEKKDMNRDFFIQNTLELIKYLLNEYNQEKLYLVGHSWGSNIGIHVAHEYPQYLHSYFGIGQVVHSILQEEISYDYVYERAKEEGNHKAIKDLEKIGYPPYDNHEKDVMTQRKWLNYYDGVEINIDTLKDIFQGTLFSPEYSLLDGVRFIAGNYFTRRTMFNSTKDYNMMDSYLEFEIPVFFIAGVSDYNTPTCLVEDYYNLIKSPRKEIFYFSESAHDPHFEEPEVFYNIVFDLIYN